MTDKGLNIAKPTGTWDENYYYTFDQYLEHLGKYGDENNMSLTEVVNKALAGRASHPIKKMTYVLNELGSSDGGSHGNQSHNVTVCHGSTTKKDVQESTMLAVSAGLKYSEFGVTASVEAKS